MPDSLTIPQELAAELGLPEAKGAPAGREFPVSRLLELQDVVLKRKADACMARASARVQSTFMPPQQMSCRSVGFYERRGR